MWVCQYVHHRYNRSKYTYFQTSHPALFLATSYPPNVSRSRHSFSLRPPFCPYSCPRVTCSPVCCITLCLCFVLVRSVWLCGLFYSVLVLFLCFRPSLCLRSCLTSRFQSVVFQSSRKVVFSPCFLSFSIFLIMSCAFCFFLLFLCVTDPV